LGPDLVDWAGDSGHVVFLPASRDVADRRLICPSELIFRIYVKPCQEKYFAFSESKSGVLDASSRASSRGTLRIVMSVGCGE
jgi:hypothetical protein